MEQKSSKTLRHKHAVSEYLKFQSLQQKQETLEEMSSISSKLLPRPGEFVVCSNTMSNSTSRTMNLSDFNRTGLLRPSSSSILRPGYYSETPDIQTGKVILTTQLRSITKPQNAEMLTLSSIAMMCDESKDMSIRPSSGIIKSIDWQQARNQEFKSKSRSELYSAKPARPPPPKPPRPQTSLAKPSEKSRLVIKKNFNVKKEIQGEGFSVTLPIDTFIKEAREELGRTDNTKFLPLEMYNPHNDNDSPKSFIKKIREKHGEARVYSKWFFADGTFEWKKCTILKFDKNVDRYLIQWENGSKKHASRINIRLLEESEDMFEERLISAGQYRDKAEVIMKYTFYIESMTSPTTAMPLKMIDCIINRVFNYRKILPKEFRVHLHFSTLQADEQHNTKRMLWKGEITHLVYEAPLYLNLGFPNLQSFKENYFKNLKKFELKFEQNSYPISAEKIHSLVNDVEKNFEYAQHKLEFEADLPYNLEKQELFSTILSPDKFVPLQEKTIFIPEKTIIYQGFMDKLEFINEHLHQASVEFFHILYKQNMQLIDFRKFEFFVQDFPQEYQLTKFVRVQKLESLDTLREFRNICFDTQYSIQDILNIANEARQKRNEERTKARIYANQVIFLENKLSPAFLDKLSRFLCLCNNILEREMRSCLDFSLSSILNQLVSLKKNIKSLGSVVDIINHFHWYKRNKKIMCIKCFLVFKDCKADIEPPLDDIIGGFKDFLWDIVKEIQKLPSLELHEIGNSREEGFMKIVDFYDEDIDKTIEKCCLFVEKLWKYPQNLVENMQSLEYLMRINIENIKKDMQNNFDLEYIVEELDNIFEAEELMENIFKSKKIVSLGLFVIKIRKAYEILKEKFELTKAVYKEILYSQAIKDIELLEEQEVEIMKIIRHIPKNLEELNDIKTFLSAHLKERYEFLDVHTKSCFDCIETMEKYKMLPDEELIYRAWNGFGLGMRIERVKYGCYNTIKRCEKEFAEQLKQNLAQIVIDIDNIRNEFLALKEESNIEKFEEISQSYGILKDNIDKTSELCKVLNLREGIVGVKMTDFKHLESLKREFSNYCKLWFYARDFFYHEPIWMRGNLCDIDSDAVSSEIELYMTELRVLQHSIFKEIPAALSVTSALLRKVNAFAPFVPILKNLKSNGIKDRHWESISKLTGIPFTKNLTMTLSSIIEQGIMNFDEEIEEISECAAREQNLESARIKMEKEWESIEFKIANFKNSNTYIIIDTNEIWEKLDEHLMKVNSMCNSPYAEFIEKEITIWKNSLFKLQEILEEWEKLQRSWSYIYPIFTSVDISNELPVVAGRFTHVNTQWENMMNTVKNNPIVIDVCWGIPKLLDQIKYSRDTLETILKSLYEYLTTKRKAFPRFYFLSNEELLTILSNSREIETVQKFIGKCFEGINKIRLQDDMIIGLESPEMETVDFEVPVKIAENQLLKNVEVWMKETETAMKTTIKNLLQICINSFTSSDNIEWIKASPSQLTQAVLQIYFTRAVETALGRTSDSMKNLMNGISEDLSKLVKLVRENLTPNMLNTISTMIILTMHNKDSVARLISGKIKSDTDFVWQVEMRYYATDKVFVKMVDTVREYGYEYLGIQGRLVITPLTDRCQRILMTALRLFLGGAPEGPAGTGKTETTKDLAKALAKKCVVFNCSDRLDHNAMAKFFIGLCYCGAWACFDEFNRMEQEVLSVVAQQITTIQTAMIKNSKKFLFEDDLVNLDDSCAVFITMNPGYAGRSELPDNLKALFRPIAMMIPDYAMIAEIFLYSYGFQQARTLARKLITSFKLSSEQLSSHKHYDYGMRAVTAVIKKAGAIKRASSIECDEEELLLQAVKESTLPKFLPEDLPLLSGILSDLFPDVQFKDTPSEITPFIHQAILEMKLVESPKFIKKAIELFELIQARHGNMVIGDAMTGKSTLIEVLSRAYALYTYYNMPVEFRGPHKVERVIINPKSITLEQLYGHDDDTSHDWTDGILSNYIRIFSESAENNGHWVILDGPVDALWIENLNTVLDDNKKLCLSSGEIIKLTSYMKMLFEVEDLEQASPATVSRCGMVYLHEDNIQWNTIRDLWLKSLPAGYACNDITELIVQLFDYFIEPCIKFFKNASTVVEFNPLWAVKNIISIMEALMLKSCMNIQEHNEEIAEIRKKMVEEKFSNIKREPTLKSIVNKNIVKKNITRRVTRRQTILNEFAVDEKAIGRAEKMEIFCFFLFSLAWGFGGFLEETSRKPFNELLYKLYSNSLGKGTGAIPLEISKRLGPVYHNDTFFTHFYNNELRNWESWNSLLMKIPKEKPSDLNFILVPCAEIVSKMYILTRLVPKGYSALVTGSSGTGKSSIVKRLISDLDISKYTYMSTTLSAQTSSNMIQEFVDIKLSKRKKGVFGGENGKKCVIVIDDLNMPTKEIYGAQPAIEILRTAIDKKEWFDLQTLEAKHLEDITYLGIMASPGGGRQSISLRYMRHMFLITASEYGSDSLETIYRTYLQTAFEYHHQRIKDTIMQVTCATIDLYQSVLLRLPPTPAKSHYTFNLRDITRVFQGVAMVGANKLDSTIKIYHLWIHECLRVFSDRLIGEDELLFRSILGKSLEKWIHIKLSEFIDEKEPLYVNFLNEKVYQECPDIDVARQALENSLEEYNIKNSPKLELVFFDFAVIHLARICRIISTANGHMLLVGTGGNGRRSLCKLAAFLQEYEIFEIQVSNTYGVGEWREDLKSLLFKTGATNSKELFILKDYEITKDIYFENVNNILNSGEVSNLFNQEEKENIVERIRELRGMSIKSVPERWEAFIQNTRKNLHIVLCMSPVGENLKKRLRQFPSFTNCCSINWMTEWPEDALRSVTENFLKESGLTTDVAKQKDIQDICVIFHYSALQTSVQYRNETKKIHNITSTHYLLFLRYVQKLMEFKKGQMIKTSEKYKQGVKKIDKTQALVGKIRRYLVSLKPVLEERTKDTEEIMKVIHTKNVEADKTRTLVSQEQKDSAIQAEIAARIKQECEEKLNKAIPELEAAIKALKTLKKDEINEVRNMQKPPHGVKLAVEAVVIINKQKPMKVPDPSDKSIINLDYFEAGKKMMKDPHFIQKLQKFDKDSLNQEVIDKLTPYIENPKFEPEMVRKASVAAEGLCKWVRAMFNYYYVNKDVKPKQESLNEAKETMAAKLKLLKDKEFELKQVEEMILDLKGEFETKNQEKQKLTADIKNCELQMGRAVKLIEKLSGERDRWSGIVIKMKEDMINLLGDIILAAGIVAYMGNFIGSYREKIMQGFWIPAVSGSKSITCSQNFLLKNVLSVEVQLQNWHIQNLPTDKASVENAIILEHSIKWPLFIDPQNQALKWISKMKQQDKIQLTVVKPGFEEFYAVIENSMFLGNSLWIENVQETLDPLLLPLLNKNFTKQQGTLIVKFGENFKTIDQKFTLYMSTTVPNPNFPPETSTKVNVINFTITQESLSEQLQAIVCKKELPKETDERNKLVHQSFNLLKKLQDFEDTILLMLQNSGENILDDEILINSLTESKTMAEETEKKLQSATVAEQRIVELQANYVSVANLSAQLYFAISDMQNIDPMYIFSMEWFLTIFNRGINKAQYTKVLPQRIENLILAFREELYSSVSMCLFEKDKLLFNFLVAIRLMQDLNAQQWRYFLTGMSTITDIKENPVKKSIKDKTWKSICEMSFIPEFSSLPEQIASNPEPWSQYLNSTKTFSEVPTFIEFCSHLPESIQNCTNLEKLLFIKVLKPEELTKAIQAFVKSVLGDHYLNHPLFSIRSAFNESDPLMPMVFILTSGNDPQQMIKNFVYENGSNIYSISLGKGQGDRATKVLKEFSATGGWVLLQNCHLMPSWMPELENIIQRFRSDSEKGMIRMHSNFRLCLTTKSTLKFPITILQHAVKIINEPSKGLKSNLKSIFQTLASNTEGQEFYNKCTKPDEWQKLLFGLCFFHCQIIERQKFGSLGWNVKYDFSAGDLKVCQRQLKLLIETYSSIPYQALLYLTGECNYGGRVTDNFDQIILNSLLEDIYKDDLMYDHFRFCGIDAYKIPRTPCSIQDFISAIDLYPSEDSPILFGLHTNASISYSREEGQYLLNCLVKIEAKSSVVAPNEKQELLKLFDEILAFLLPEFSLTLVKDKYPVLYEESLNTFLQQEVQKYNNLNRIIKQSIGKLKKALEGHIVITHELEDLTDSILKNKVPDMWTAFSYLSSKPLMSWIQDLNKRLTFFTDWVQKSYPKVYWFSGFFFPQSFLTSLLQNYARTNKIAIDTLQFSIDVMNDMPKAEIETGCYINGLFIEGARWDCTNNSIEEAFDKELYSVMPVIWLKPTEKAEDTPRKNKVYNCPVYRTAIRAGTLSTTGHSTNYVMTLPLLSIMDEKHWIKRGVAIITQLND